MDGWKGKGKRNAVTRGTRSLYSTAKDSLIPGERKGGGISIR